MRKFSTYEYNQLLKYGKLDTDLSQIGEMPIEYVTGFVEFYGREFIVDKNVLIPRVETEDIISLSLNLLNDKKEINIADVGTGSGIIGISLYLEFKNLDKNPLLYLSDISGEALGIAHANIEKLIPDAVGNVNFLQSNLLDDYPGEVYFDLIIANLPYIPLFRKNELDKSVTDYEPHLALFGGNEGLDLIHKLIEQSKKKLRPNGYLVLEVDDTHTEEKFEKFKEDFEIELKKDQFDKNRFIIMKRV